MNLFKRVEVWVLLALLGAGIGFVLVSSNKDDDDPAALPKQQQVSAGKFTVASLALRRDYANFELRIGVDYDNRDGAEIDTATAAALLADGDRKIPPFFLAIAPPPKIPAGKRERVELRYWLESADLKGPLWLDVLGARVQVKPAAPFDPESMDNQSERPVRPADWNAL